MLRSLRYRSFIIETRPEPELLRLRLMQRRESKRALITNEPSCEIRAPKQAAEVMTTLRIVSFFALTVWLTFAPRLAVGQAHQSRHSANSPDPDSFQSANKPLTPKSAMPSAHKSTVSAPQPSSASRHTNSELNQLEEKNTKAPTSHSASTVPAKSPTAAHSAGKAAANSGSAIDFKYQQPVGGMKASNPAANSKYSSTPRVSKKN